MVAGQVAASVAWYGALIAAALGLDWLLHRAGLGWVGRHLGPIGSIMLIGSFAYSLRKRRYIGHGSLKAWLTSHEVASWVGVLLLLVHAGIHVNAVLPWLAVGAMLVAVASGFTGKVLLGRSREVLRASSRALEEQGVEPAEAERRLMLDSLAVDAMMHWRSVHLPITAVFGVLVVLHVATVLAFW